MELEDFKIKVFPSRQKLYRFARGFLNHDEEAEDTVQDVMLKLWDMRQRLDEYNSVEALALRMVRNQCLDKLKSKRNGLLDIENHSRNMISHFEQPDKSTEMQNTIQWVHQAIAQLPEQQRQIIRLRDIEELEYEEIAEILGFDLNYIRVNLSRARKKLREILGEI